jgi:hypothetical protein
LTKEEHAVDSLKKICLAILSSDKNVRFVGVVDSKGKLLVGEYNIYRFFERNDNNNNNAYLVKSSTFYSSYVVPAIKIRKKVKANQSQVVHFKLVELGDEVYLAVIPLLMEKRYYDNNNNSSSNSSSSSRYLCIYIELEDISSEAAVSSSLTTTSYKEIISKIINDSI